MELRLDPKRLWHSEIDLTLLMMIERGERRAGFAGVDWRDLDRRGQQRTGSEYAHPSVRSTDRPGKLAVSQDGFGCVVIRRCWLRGNKMALAVWLGVLVAWVSWRIQQEQRKTLTTEYYVSIALRRVRRWQNITVHKHSPSVSTVLHRKTKSQHSSITIQTVLNPPQC